MLISKLATEKRSISLFFFIVPNFDYIVGEQEKNKTKKKQIELPN